MTQPADEPTRDDAGMIRPDQTSNGNPGRPQSDFEFDDAEPETDHSEFSADEEHEVMPGPAVPADAKHSHLGQD